MLRFRQPTRSTAQPHQDPRGLRARRRPQPGEAACLRQAAREPRHFRYTNAGARARTSSEVCLERHESARTSTTDASGVTRADVASAVASVPESPMSGATAEL